MADRHGASEVHVPVLIVGGGPIGLMASVLLSHFGVESLLVNQRATTSTHPRARFIDVRTTEIFRQLGLADLMVATGLPPGWVQSVRYSQTFAEPEVYRLPTQSYHVVPRDYSPTVPIMTAQDLVEPILYQAAQSHDGADVRFGTELIALDQDAESCRSTLRDCESGALTDVTSSYVIGADGRNSSVRALLGGDLDVGISSDMSIQDVLFHADMSRWIGDRIGALLFTYHPMGYGLFQPMDGKTRWRAQCTLFTPPIPADQITEADCVAWIRSAIGDTEGELQLDVESIAPWSPEARLSDDFRRDRVFLAGDAAHMLFPTGGYGMNLGYHGIHNLAWKLAFVLEGVASPDILDTYETERCPQADRTQHASVANAQLAGALYRTFFTSGDLDEAGHALRQYGNFEGMILAPEYASALVDQESEPGPHVENDLVDFVPCVRSGRRAPHVWLDDAQEQSVLDLFGRAYVLLTDGRPSSVVDRAVALRSTGFPIRAETLPKTAYASGLYTPEEHVLVRPDGIVAARISPDDPTDLATLVAATQHPPVGVRKM